MPTITISSGTTSVSTAIPNTTAYLVESSGTLDIVSGGIVSGLITISSGGHVIVASGGEAFDTVVSGGGILTVASGGTVTSAGTPVNSGGITGTGSNAKGVYFLAGGSVTNAASALIAGGAQGVEIAGGAG